MTIQCAIERLGLYIILAQIIPLRFKSCTMSFFLLKLHSKRIQISQVLRILCKITVKINQSIKVIGIFPLISFNSIDFGVFKSNRLEVFWWPQINDIVECLFHVTLKICFIRAEYFLFRLSRSVALKQKVDFLFRLERKPGTRVRVNTQRWGWSHGSWSLYIGFVYLQTKVFFFGNIFVACEVFSRFCRKFGILLPRIF